MRAGGRTKREAEKAYYKAAETIENEGGIYDAERITVKQFLETWFTDYVELNLRDATIKSYKSDLKNHIVPALGKYRLGKINSRIIQKFINCSFMESFLFHTHAPRCPLPQKHEAPAPAHKSGYKDQ